MKLFISTILLLLLPVAIHAQENNRWFIEKADGKLGFIDSTGTEVFTGKYEMLSEHYNSGLVPFMKNGKYGYLDVNGKSVFRTKKFFGRYSEGLLAVESEDRFYYLGTDGEIAIDLNDLHMPKGKEISKTFRFSDGLAMIVVKDAGFDDTGHEGDDILFAEYVNPYPGNWYYGFINRLGEFAIHPRLSSATTYQDGVSLAMDDSITFFMDTLGQVITVLDENTGDIITEVSSDVFDFAEGFAIVYERIDSCTFINLEGERITQKYFRRANQFSDGMASVQLDGKWGFIDTTGTLTIEPQYFIRSDFSEGLAPVSLRMEENGYSLGSYFIEGFIDKNGEVVIPFQPHVDYGGFKNGLTKGRRFIYDDKRYTGYYELFYMNHKAEKVWSEVVKQ